MAGAVLAVAVLANTAIKAGLTIVIGWRHGGWARGLLFFALLTSCETFAAWQLL